MTAIPAQMLDGTREQQIAMDAEAVERLAERLRDNYATSVRSRIRITAQHNLRASSFGQLCDRRLYHDVKDWQTQAPVDPQVQQYFDRGNDLEPLVMKKLNDIGLRVIEQQVAYWDDELRVGAHIDGKAVIVEDDDGRRMVVETKASANPSLAKCRTVEDLLHNKWGRRYYVQCMIYMRLAKCNVALLVVWDTAPWEPVFIVIPFDPMTWELIADRAKRINQALDTNTPPDFISDSRECRVCPHFGRACNPPISFGKGAQILTDEELLAEIEEWDGLKDAGKRYNQLDGAIKKRLKDSSDDPQDGLFIIGPYEIHRTVGSRKGYEVKASKPQTIDVQKVA